MAAAQDHFPYHQVHVIRLNQINTKGNVISRVIVLCLYPCTDYELSIEKHEITILLVSRGNYRGIGTS